MAAAALADDELVARVLAGDGEAQRALVERAGLRVAKAVLRGGPAERRAVLLEIVRAEGPAPGLGALLAGVARDADASVTRAAEDVYRTSRERWGEAERRAFGAFVAATGARLGAPLALELLEWAAGQPGDVAGFVAGARAAVATLAAADAGGAGAKALEDLAWRSGFGDLLARDEALAVTWSADPATARPLARALLSVHARGRISAVPALERVWSGTARRDVWAAALGEAVAANRGMSGRDEVAGWGWRRFCDHPDERVELYRAFRAWRDAWIELRNAMPGAARPGGGSAIEHLRLWAGLDVEVLAATVEEVARLASDDEWAALVDLAFDLADVAPLGARPHALAGVCRAAAEVAARARGRDAPSAAIDGAADRLIARAEALSARLRDAGAALDAGVAARLDDLATEVRLIREARVHREERAADARARAAREAEQARQDAERAAEVARQVDEARRRAEEAVRAVAAAMTGAAPRLTAASVPAVPREPIDDEVVLDGPAPTLLDYARMIKRMSSGAPDALPALAADGLALEQIALVSQRWSGQLALRPALALRFAALVAAPWR